MFPNYTYKFLPISYLFDYVIYGKIFCIIIENWCKNFRQKRLKY